MSEMISREDAIEFLCSETVGRGDIYDDAYEKAVSDMEKLEKIEQILFRRSDIKTEEQAKASMVVKFMEIEQIIKENHNDCRCK